MMIIILFFLIKIENQYYGSKIWESQFSYIIRKAFFQDMSKTYSEPC